MKAHTTTLQLDQLKTELEGLKTALKDIEANQRKFENELKALRQQEIRTKRQIEALNTLLELNEEPTPAAG